MPFHIHALTVNLLSKNKLYKKPDHVYAVENFQAAPLEPHKAFSSSNIELQLQDRYLHSYHIHVYNYFRMIPFNFHTDIPFLFFAFVKAFAFSTSIEIFFCKTISFFSSISSVQRRKNTQQSIQLFKQTYSQPDHAFQLTG